MIGLRPAAACVVLLLAASGAGSAPSPEPRPDRIAPLAEHVVLVSIDALRPEFYLDPAWPAPMIQQMAREGAHARGVRGVFPSVTYPSHTTILTSALPARHGVHYNEIFEPTGHTGRWYWETSAIRAPTLWEAARQAGLTTANIAWPVSVGAPLDWNVPEIWPLDDTDPVELLRRHTTPAGLLEEIEAEATGRLTATDISIDEFVKDDRTAAMAAHLIEAYRPNLMTVHITEVDHFQHEDGRDGPRVRRAVVAADRAVSRMVEAAERAGILDSTAFVITGDHGMIHIHTAVAANLLLVKAGLLELGARRSGHAPGTGASAASSSGEIDWRAVFHTSAASAFLHLRDPEDRTTLARVRQILADLPRGVRELFRVVERAELDELGAAPEAALALAPVPGVVISFAAREPLLRPVAGATHGYLPSEPLMHTGFVGWGAGFRSGAVADLLGMEQIAPLVARLLGLDFHAPDGVAPPGLLAASGEVASADLLAETEGRRAAARKGRTHDGGNQRR